MARDKQMAKLGFVSFVIAAFTVFKMEFGWLAIIVLIPMTAFVALILALILEILETMVRWFNK